MRHPERVSKPPGLGGPSGETKQSEADAEARPTLDPAKFQAVEAVEQQSADIGAGHGDAFCDASETPVPDESANIPGAEIGAKKTAGNGGSQEPKSRPAVNPRQRLEFIRVNSVTFKLTDGRQVKTWDGNRGHRHAPRALAWLMAVGIGQWVVRHRNTASKPMTLPKARTWCLETLRGIRPVIKFTIAEHIVRLNRLHLDATEPMPTLAEVVAIERETFPPLTRPMRDGGAA